MNDPVYQRLRETAWRRKLTPAEEVELRVWLAAHPEAVAECELEFALSDALVKLPNAAVPSNFTARVLQGIERRPMRAARSRRRWTWNWNYLLPRAALTIMVAGGVVFGYRLNHSSRQAEVIAVRDSLVTITAVESLPKTEALLDFDTIQKLNTESVADQELLALFQ
jgi:anti-sigma factor RsiW